MDSSSWKKPQEKIDKLYSIAYYYRNLHNACTILFKYSQT